MTDLINDVFAEIGKRFVRESLEEADQETNGIIQRLEKIEAALTNVMKTQQKHHARITEVEDCVTCPDNGSEEEKLLDDPKHQIWKKLYEVAPDYKSRKTGLRLPETKRLAFASRVTNALWEAGYKNPDKIRTISHKRLERIKNLGPDGRKLVRLAFPWIG